MITQHFKTAFPRFGTTLNVGDVVNPDGCVFVSIDAHATGKRGHRHEVVHLSAADSKQLRKALKRAEKDSLK